MFPVTCKDCLQVAKKNPTTRAGQVWEETSKNAVGPTRASSTATMTDRLDLIRPRAYHFILHIDGKVARGFPFAFFLFRA